MSAITPCKCAAFFSLTLVFLVLKPSPIATSASLLKVIEKLKVAVPGTG